MCNSEESCRLAARRFRRLLDFVEAQMKCAVLHTALYGTRTLNPYRDFEVTALAVVLLKGALHGADREAVCDLLAWRAEGSTVPYSQMRSLTRLSIFLTGFTSSS